MTPPRPIRLLLPASFLLVLGVGNLLVGYYKERQYVQVYEELLRLEPGATNPQVIGVLRTAQDIAERHLQRKREVLERQDFYRLVTFGGKAFCTLSLVLATLAFAAASIRLSREGEESEPDLEGAASPEVPNSLGGVTFGGAELR